MHARHRARGLLDLPQFYRVSPTSVASIPAPASPLRFGACELHPGTRELRVDGAGMRVGARAFDLLLALAEARGEVETGDAPSAVVHQAVRLMRGAGALDWMGGHLAEWLTQRGQFADAARLLGWLQPRQAGRPVDAQTLAAQARVQADLCAQADAPQQQDWQARGARWSDNDVALMLLGVN